MNKIPFIFAAVLLLVVAVTLFRSFSRSDVSSDPSYQGGYVPGSTYRLKVDAQYFPVRGNMTRTGVKINGSLGTLIPAGTRLKLDRIEYLTDINHSETLLHAHFVDGPLGGTSTDIGGISRASEHSGIAGVRELDPDMLELVK